MANLKQFDYKGQTITFEFSDGNKMINATEMAKPFGKPVGNFLRLKETKQYVTLLQSRYSDVNNSKEVLRIVRGGDAESRKLQATWMDEKLALKFAAWLAPEFELWVYDRIHELLTTGKTELPAIKPTTDIISAIRLIADKLESQEQDISDLKEGLQDMKDVVTEIEAKITSADENYYAVSGYCALKGIACPLQVAQKYGRAAIRLSKNKGYPIGRAYHPLWGQVGTYHKDVLKEIIDN